MSSDEEDYDIAGNLVATGFSSDEESGSDSGSENEYEGEVQDEIMSSEDDDEEEEEKPKKKEKAKKEKNTKKPVNDKSFFNLELSDDEDDKSNKNSNDMEYFASLNQPNAKKAKAGTFASFGLSKFILVNIAKKGFKQPTPIQRKTIPFIMNNRDVVGMARTGSGKTAAFVLPLIEKLKAHQAKIGIRAIIMSPSRELATQTYKQVKEFSRNSDLRAMLVLGGETMEENFSGMMANPDILVVTPGRFLHLKTEMQLDLKTVEYIVYDEADRLFEQGFAEQLNELLASFPQNRQSLLFSATLPKSLVDFAKAGLNNPVLVRLDAETKVSDNLEMAFISSKKNEREANLLCLLSKTIGISLATADELKKLKDVTNQDDSSDEDNNDDDGDDKNKKRKRKFTKRPRLPKANELPTEKSTVIFVPTKHHVEYINNLLTTVGYATAYIYGSLDQFARKRQLLNFRLGLCPILVVTDVAARGIDIPVLANVINYSLPSSSKIFIHRVGRTARAGNKGWAYSIVSEAELPYLLDLEVFLGKKVLITPLHEKKVEILEKNYKAKNNDSLDGFVPPKVPYTDRLVLGSSPRLDISDCQETYQGIMEHNYDLKMLKDVAEKGEKLYFRTRTQASAESMRRAKELINLGWDEQHVLYGPNLEKEKEEFLLKLQNRNHKETVFEFSKKDESLMEMMNKRRRQIAPIQRKAKERKELLENERLAGLTHGLEDELFKESTEIGYSGVAEDELLASFEDADQLIEEEKEQHKRKKQKKTFRDPNFFLPHYAPASSIQDQQLSLDAGFANAAQQATFDLDDDDKVQNHKQTQRTQWDKKKGKYITVQDDKKYIIGESGQRIPASYRSGKFDEWKSSNNITGYRVGAMETANAGKLSSGRRGPGGRYQHLKVQAPKLPDRARDDYHKQMKKVKAAVDNGVAVKGWSKSGGARNEIKSTEQIRKGREQKEKRREKNNRPSKKGRR